jgi:hypothetical protein
MLPQHGFQLEPIYGSSKTSNCRVMKFPVQSGTFRVNGLHYWISTSPDRRSNQPVDIGKIVDAPDSPSHSTSDIHLQLRSLESQANILWRVTERQRRADG